MSDPANHLPAMSAIEFHAALRRLNMTQAQASDFFCAGERTVKRWAADGAPPMAAMLLRLMVAEQQITEAVVRQCAGEIVHG